MLLGDRIKQLRLLAGLTQTELAHKIGRSCSYLSRIERNQLKNPSYKVIDSMARVFRMTASQITNGNSKIRPETPEMISERLRAALPLTVGVYDEFHIHAPGPTEVPEDYIYLNRSKVAAKNIQAVRVHGNCMAPAISEGDFIVVDLEGQIDVGSIIVCLVDDSFHIGRLRKIADEVWLENNDGRVKLDDCKVPARVIAVHRRL